MRKSKMWRMMTVAAVAASMTCGVFGVQSVNADEMKTLKDFIVSGEYEFKKGIITDALASERDFLGQFTVRQSMRELLYAGIVLGGGAAMEHDYSHHVSHLPFVGTSQDGEPVVGLSPIARALWDTKEGKVYNGEESEFGLVGDFLNNWLRSQGS